MLLDFYPKILEIWQEHTNDILSVSTLIGDVSVSFPVFTGGFQDGYRDTVFRLAEYMLPNFRGIVGPWSHKLPYNTLPGTSINLTHLSY